MGKSKKKNKVEDVKFDVVDLEWLVMEVFPDAHAIAVFRESGVDIIAETEEVRKLIEKAFEGRIINTKHDNTGFVGYG